MFGLHDTIVALATPPGVGALSLIRISGENALGILDILAPRSRPGSRTSHSAFVGKLYREGKLLDEALVTLFRAPATFTGEDVVELGLHGSPFITREVLQACLEAGCRLAGPGEFTQRAYLNGKLDLAQAEAVGDLIAAENAAAHRTALHQLKGGLSKEIADLRQQLIDFTALIELELDFGEEDVEFADRTRLRTLVDDIQERIGQLLKSFATGQAIKNGIPVVIVGPPNAGKSTLLNALLEEEKAIVSPIPGTTRDVIEDQMVLEGIAFRFVDTAGLRQTEDVVEQIGIERTRQQLDRAAFVLLLRGPDSDPGECQNIQKEIEERGLPYLRLFTKVDWAGVQIPDGWTPISAPLKLGLEELKADLVARAVDQTVLQTESTLLTNARHYEALQKTRQALTQVQAALDEALSGDLLATDIREALYHLGSITGEISVEEILGSIFSRFCIGK